MTYQVLIFAPMIGRGGVHLVVEALSRGFEQFANDKWEFSILGQDRDEIGLSVRWPESWRFTRVRPAGVLPQHPNLFPYLMSSSDHFVSHLKEFAPNYDLVYCPNPWWIAQLRKEKWELKTPFVCTIPDFAFDHIDMGELTGIFRTSAMLLGRRDMHTVFSSGFHKSHAVKKYGFRRSSIISHSADFVDHGLDNSAEEIERVRQKYGLPETYVLAFHCAYHKDPVTILRAQFKARSTSAAVPPLVMAGIDTDRFLQRRPMDDHILEVQRTMGSIGVNPGTDFWSLGYIPDEDIGGLFGGAAVVVSASKSEGDISGPMFYAFKCKTPLVYSDLPVYRDRLGRKNDYGLAFPVGDAKALAEKIVAVCESPRLANRLVESAYQFSIQRRLDDVIYDYLKVFEEEICLSKFVSE